MFGVIARSKQTVLIGLVYLIIAGWWVWIRTHGIENAYLFNWSYGLIGLSSSIYAWTISRRKWGGFNSAVGKLLILLGLGLFAQWVGLQIWTYYNVIAKVEVPYPSLADIGYFGLVPAYTYAAYMLAKVCAVRLSLKSPKGKLIVLLLPLLALALAFGLFLRNIGLDTSHPIKMFFDLAYPIGEIVPVTIALITLILTNENIGGKMRSRILWLIFAFFFQFFTEYTFLYQSGKGTYVNGGVSDFLYATSYLIMGLGIIGFSRLDRKESSNTTPDTPTLTPPSLPESGELQNG